MKQLGFIGNGSSTSNDDPFSPDYVPTFQTEAPTPATSITSPPGWNASVQRAIAAGDAPAALVPYVQGPPGPTAWQQISAWIYAHQKDLLIVAAALAGFAILREILNRSEQR